VIDMNEFLSMLKSYDENFNPSIMLEQAIPNGKRFGDLFEVLEKVDWYYFQEIFDISARVDTIERMKKKLIRIPPSYTRGGFF